MKIVIPTNDEERDNEKGIEEEIAEHFGRCKTYTFLDENGEIIEIIKNTSEHMGGKGVPPELMKKHNAEVLICRGIGAKAIQICNQFGIKVYICKEQKVKDAYESWKKGELEEACINDACRH